MSLPHLGSGPPSTGFARLPGLEQAGSSQIDKDMTIDSLTVNRLKVNTSVNAPVMRLLATKAIPFTAAQASVAVTTLTVPNSTIQFILAQQQTVFILGALTAAYLQAAGVDNAVCWLQPTTPLGAQTTPQGVLQSAAAAPYQTVTLWQVVTLAKGTYNACWDWQGAVTGNNLQISSGKIDVFVISQ